MKPIFISLLLMGTGCSAKYTVGDCVTPTNPNWTWHKKIAYVGAVDWGNNYKLSFYNDNSRKWSAVNSIFDYSLIHDNTVKIPCP